MDEDDPLRFLNDDDLEMMSQPYDHSGYQHAHEEMDDVPAGQERPSRVDCKKSLFMQSSQDMPEDVASMQAQLAEGRTVLSQTTLGQELRKGLEGQPKKKERRRPAGKGSTS